MIFTMENVGVDTIVRDGTIFDLYKQETPQIKSQTMRHTLMN